MITADQIQSVFAALQRMYSGNELFMMLFYLTRNLSGTSNESRNEENAITMMSRLADQPQTFESYTNQVVRFNARQNRQELAEQLQQVYERYAVHSDYSSTPIQINTNAIIESCGFGFAYALRCLSPEDQRLIACTVPQLFGARSCPEFTNAIQNALDNIGVLGYGSTVLLATVYLTREGVNAVLRWQRREITGKRCAQLLIVNISAIGGGISGGMVGAAYLKQFGPYGEVIGAVVGSAIGSAMSAVLSDVGTRYFLDLPVEETTEAAYNFLGVSHRALAREVNAAFYQRCAELRNNQRAFADLQACMVVIKRDRGEYA